MREVGNIFQQILILSHHYIISATVEMGRSQVKAMLTSILTSVDETTIQLEADLDTNTGAVVLKKPDHGKWIFMY